MSADEHPAASRSVFDIIYAVVFSVLDEHGLSASGHLVCTCGFFDAEAMRSPDYSVYTAYKDHIATLTALTLEELGIGNTDSILKKLGVIVRDRLDTYADFQESLQEKISPQMLRDMGSTLSNLVETFRNK